MTATALVASVLLLLANAFFVAAEFALLAARRTRLEQLAADGSSAAELGLTLSRQLSFHLAGAQLGITMASLGLGFFAEPAVAHLLEDLLHEIAAVPEDLAHTISFVIALSIVVFLHMVVGEMVPKNVAIAAPERSLLVMAWPIRAYSFVFGVPIRVLNSTANGLLRLVGSEVRDELSREHTADDFADMIAESAAEGLLGEGQQQLLTRALRFRQRPVSSIMIPLAEVVSVDRGATVADVETVVVDSGHTRILVRGTEPGSVLGFVHAKDLIDLRPAARDRPVPPRLIRPMLRVTPALTLHEAQLRLRRSRTHLAVVLDDVGAIAGLVSLEDVCEQLVGDIRDEHDE